MGDTKHTTIIVTDWSDKSLAAAHGRATRLGLEVTPIVWSQFNHFGTFCVVPHGGKIGGGLAAEADANRAVFKAWLRTDPVVIGLDWVEVEYGAIIEGAEVSDSAWADDEGAK